MRPALTYLLVCIVLTFGLAASGCAPAADTDPAGTTPAAPTATPDAEPLEPPVTEGSYFEQLQASGYADWATAPGYDMPQAAKGPHGDTVSIYLNEVAASALNAKAAEWPVGTIIVKDIFSGGSLAQVASMERVADGWLWGEWNTDGSPIAEGVGVEPCEGCHTQDADATLAIELGK